jgi:hypothetical protein
MSASARLAVQDAFPWLSTPQSAQPSLVNGRTPIQAVQQVATGGQLERTFQQSAPPMLQALAASNAQSGSASSNLQLLSSLLAKQKGSAWEQRLRNELCVDAISVSRPESTGLVSPTEKSGIAHADGAELTAESNSKIVPPPPSSPGAASVPTKMSGLSMALSSLKAPSRAKLTSSTAPAADGAASLAWCVNNLSLNSSLRRAGQQAGRTAWKAPLLGQNVSCQRSLADCDLVNTDWLGSVCERTTSSHRTVSGSSM